MDISSIIGAYGTQRTNDVFSPARKKEEESAVSAFDSKGDTVTLSQEARELFMRTMFASYGDEDEDLEKELLEKNLRQAAEIRKAAEKEDVYKRQGR